MKKPIWVAIIVAIVIFLGVVGYANLRHFRKPAASIPTTRVKQGNVLLKVYTTGDLAAEKSVKLIAPRVSGNSLTIVKLLPTGTQVKKGEVVMAFDPSGEEYNLQQAQAQLSEAEEEITKAKDDAAVQVAEDQAQLLTDKYTVEKDEITVSTNELVSAIDAKKNVLALDQAKRILAQLESDIKSHALSGKATLAVNEQNKAKAQVAIQQAERNIKNMTVESPIDGIVEAQKNYWAVGGFITPGMQIPDFRVGDSAFSGANVAQVIDPTQMQVRASLNETDRGNVRIGQHAEINVDALAAKSLAGEIKNISGSASRGGGFFSVGAIPTFSLTIQLNQTDPNLRPGQTVHVVFSGNPLKNALYLPPQAIFQKNGSPVVYAKRGNSFVAVPVKVRYRTATQTVIEGAQPGEVVALVNPESSTGTASPTTGTGMTLPGGAQGGR